MEHSFGLDDEHPLARELASLRNAVRHYETASQNASLQLQRQAFEIAAVQENSRLVTQHNAHLEKEVEALRARDEREPSTDPSSAASAELALLRAQERLLETEAQLLAQTRSINDLQASIVRHEAREVASRRLVEDARERANAAVAATRETRLALRQAIEERNMSDHVVHEYADLVKSLEAKKSRASLSSVTSISKADGSNGAPTSPSNLDVSSNGSAAPTTSSTPLSSMIEGRNGLERLVQEMSTETNRLHAEIQALHAQVETAKVELSTLETVGDDTREKLAAAQAELIRHQADDRAAAKLVSRYMSFSQTSTNVLQNALTSTKNRHAATVATLNARVQQAERSILHERSQSERLRRALDDATQDISRATYGRRREISLRMGMLVREERIVEDLRRWTRRAEEALSAVDAPDNDAVDSIDSQRHRDSLWASVASSLATASDVLVSIDGNPASNEAANDASSGPLSRIILAQDTLKSVLAELHNETEARMSLMRQLGVENRSAATKPTPSNVAPPLSSDSTRPATPVVQTHQVSSGSAAPPPPLDSQSEDTETTPTENTTAVDDQPVILQGAELHDDNAFPHHEEETLDTVAPPADDIADNNVDSPPADPQPVISPVHARDSPLPPHTPSPAPLLPPQLVVFPSPAASSITLETSAHAEVYVQLDAVASRYDAIQRSLRDCHRSLASLKADFVAQHPEPGANPHDLPAIVKASLERLDDFAEDAMVEVEIRAADDARLAEGFKTLLGVSSAPREGSGEAHDAAVLQDITAFLDESNPTHRVRESKDAFLRKVDDLQHDIATLKFAIHQSSFAQPEGNDTASQSPPERPGWSRWASGVFSSPRTPSPRPASPSPSHQSFGAVMTSAALRSPSPALHDAAPPSPQGLNDIMKQLDFRISMPFQKKPYLSAPPAGLDAPIVAPWARSRTVSLANPRPRAVSGIGLGPAPSRYDASRLSQSQSAPKRLNGHDSHDDVTETESSDVE